jgi:Mrp family chromosome partitioning ATPase
MSRLAVLAEIGAPTSSNGRTWGLRRHDLEALGEVRGKLGERRVVLVTGAEAAAPTVAVALAGVAAAAGVATALVECDIERPRLAGDLGLAANPGLHEYLRWEATPADVLQPLALAGAAASTDAGTLACVVAGRQSDAAHTLLGLGSFRHMTAKLRGAPLEGAGGALDAAAAEADCSIAALRERPDRRAAKASHKALAWLQAPPLGAIVVGDS